MLRYNTNCNALERVFIPTVNATMATTQMRKSLTHAPKMHQSFTVGNKKIVKRGWDSGSRDMIKTKR